MTGVTETAPTPPSRSERPLPRGCGLREITPKPPEPTVEHILCRVLLRRQERGCVLEFHAGIEASAVAFLGLLWRKAHQWYGVTGTYATTYTELALGLGAVLPNWPAPPHRHQFDSRQAYRLAANEYARTHQSSIYRWLREFAATGLFSFESQNDRRGRRYRIKITLHACPGIPGDVRAKVRAREAHWPRLEARRRARGRKRDLSTIRANARLSEAEKRRRGTEDRRRQRARQQAQRVQAQAAERQLGGFGRAPGAETNVSVHQRRHVAPEPSDRGHARAGDCGKPDDESSAQPGTTSKEGARGGNVPTARLAALQALLGRRWIGRDTSAPDGLRWQVYDEVLADRPRQTASDHARFVPQLRRETAALLRWTDDELPDVRRFARPFVALTYGDATLAVLPRAFRLGFVSQHRDTAALAGACAAYRRARAGDALPAGFPVNPVAGFAYWLIHHARRQEGPSHGLGAELGRFAAFARAACRYEKASHADYLSRGAEKAARRQAIAQLAEKANRQLGFRRDAGAALSAVEQLLASDYAPHQAAGRRLLAVRERRDRLAERDQRFLRRQHPGSSDNTYLAACRYAERWKLPDPDARRRERAAAGAIETVRRAAQSSSGRTD